MDTVFLALLAEISVRADRAHVAYASNRVSFAAVARNLLMNSSILLNFFDFKVSGEHSFEALVTVLLNFLADHGRDSGYLF